MEDILSSIKRIIAEENDTLPGRTKRPDRSLARRGDVDPAVRDDILELREAVAAAMPTLLLEAVRAVPLQEMGSRRTAHDRISAPDR